MSVRSKRTYLVAGTLSWNRQVFDEEIRNLPGEWRFIGSRDLLTPELVNRVRPRFIFFLHWSWLVPAGIVEHYECVNFHITDLPYGRGGSPVQNLISRGHRTTRLTAHRMTSTIDAGPVYLKEDLSLVGTCQEILVRAGYLSRDMIERIIVEEPEPIPQQGDAVVFRRRTADESAMPRSVSLEQLYDFIRMLDCDGYPHAFLDSDDLRIEFTNAQLHEGHLTATVKVTRQEGG